MNTCIECQLNRIIYKNLLLFVKRSADCVYLIRNDVGARFFVGWKVLTTHVRSGANVGTTQWRKVIHRFLSFLHTEYRMVVSDYPGSFAA